jgi:hypothetical protein
MIVALAVATVFRESQNKHWSCRRCIRLRASHREVHSTHEDSVRMSLERPLLSNFGLRSSRRERAVFSHPRIEVQLDGHSRSSYEIRVITADGDLVWEGQTDKLAIALPSDVILKDGSYFVWVTSYSSNGRTIKSAPAPFRVKR